MMQRRHKGRRLLRLALLACCLPFLTYGPPPAHGLEKYGRPLPSMDEPNHETREEEETLFGGYLLTGAFVKNPTFAARPDNTGLVGMRHMLHLETDLYKQYLTFYTDQNFFSTAPTAGSRYRNGMPRLPSRGSSIGSIGACSTSVMRPSTAAASSKPMRTRW